MKIRLDHPLLRRQLPRLSRWLVGGLFRLCPAHLVATEATDRLIRSGRPVIFTPWHCHLLAPIYCFWRFYPGLPPLALMASPSRDGELIAAVGQGLGFPVAAGSRQKGGVQALRQLAGYMARGHSCGLIADGSRGPAHEVQKGVVFLARETQAPIIPVAAAAARKLTFNTWDRFELPLPLSRLAILLGEPLSVPLPARGPALEAARQDLETRLNRLFGKSQTYFAA
jgi:lysophospholipid acyltransferase (LPLAT)-like uncharacterized protein